MVKIENVNSKMILKNGKNNQKIIVSPVSVPELASIASGYMLSGSTITRNTKKHVVEFLNYLFFGVKMNPAGQVALTPTGFLNTFKSALSQYRHIASVAPQKTIKGGKLALKIANRFGLEVPKLATATAGAVVSSMSAWASLLQSIIFLMQVYAILPKGFQAQNIMNIIKGKGNSKDVILTTISVFILIFCVNLNHALKATNPNNSETSRFNLSRYRNQAALALQFYTMVKPLLRVLFIFTVNSVLKIQKRKSGSPRKITNGRSPPKITNGRVTGSKSRTGSRRSRTATK